MVNNYNWLLDFFGSSNLIIKCYYMLKILRSVTYHATYTCDLEMLCIYRRSMVNCYKHVGYSKIICFMIFTFCSFFHGWEFPIFEFWPGLSVNFFFFWMASELSMCYFSFFCSYRIAEQLRSWALFVKAFSSIHWDSSVCLAYNIEPLPLIRVPCS